MRRSRPTQPQPSSQIPCRVLSGLDGTLGLLRTERLLPESQGHSQQADGDGLGLVPGVSFPLPRVRTDPDSRRHYNSNQAGREPTQSGMGGRKDRPGGGGFTGAAAAAALLQPS